MIQAALDGGAPADEALAMLDRLNRLDTAPEPGPARAVARVRAARPLAARSRRPLARGLAAAASRCCSWSSSPAPSRRRRGIARLARPGCASRTRRVGAAALPRRRASAAPPLPRRGELALARARSLAAGGHLHDALAALDAVRPPIRRSRTPIGCAATSSASCSAARDGRSAARARERGWAPAMKCPKCGYLGFEDVDRCRNCGYDFSLAQSVDLPELPMRGDVALRPLEDLALVESRRRRPPAPCAGRRGRAISIADASARRPPRPPPSLLLFDAADADDVPLITRRRRRGRRSPCGAPRPKCRACAPSRRARRRSTWAPTSTPADGARRRRARGAARMAPAGAARSTRASRRTPASARASRPWRSTSASSRSSTSVVVYFTMRICGLASPTSGCCRRGPCWRSCSCRTAATSWRSRPAARRSARWRPASGRVGGAWRHAGPRARAPARRCLVRAGHSRPASAS